MGYTKAAISEINKKYAEIKDSYKELLLPLSDLRTNLKNKKAQEYLMQGAARRIKILSRVIDNVFTIFPLEQNDLLSSNKLTDLSINLHAFFVNISGIFDNLGWVFIYENNLFGEPKEGKVNKHGVGLFNEKTQQHLNPELKAYLTSERTQSWYNSYSKNYRDALAHRIPLYVPPAGLTDEEVKEYQTLENRLWDFSSIEKIKEHDLIREKQSQLGRPCFFFAHSLDEDGRPMYFHAQIVTDFITVDEIVKKFCQYF